MRSGKRGEKYGGRKKIKGKWEKRERKRLRKDSQMESERGDAKSETFFIFVAKWIVCSRCRDFFLEASSFNICSETPTYIKINEKITLSFFYIR